MAFIGEEKTREVYGLEEKEKDAIFYFLQGTVYSWCKNRKDEWFSLRDLMGKENFYWEGTPLYALYKKHEDKGKSGEEAIKEAGKDAGWMLKKVLNDDKRTFNSKKDGLVKAYFWEGNEI